MIYIDDNKAGLHGGAISVETSDLTLAGGSLIKSNTARHGGAIHAVNSNIDFSGSHSFVNNSGEFGGGLSLALSSYLTCSHASIVVLNSNHASKQGGAIWVEDPSSYRCIDQGQTPPLSNCFFQLNLTMMGKCVFFLRNNSAILAGSNLYGGNIDKCILDEDFDKIHNFSSANLFNATFQSVNKSAISHQCHLMLSKYVSVHKTMSRTVP